MAVAVTTAVAVYLRGLRRGRREALTEDAATYLAARDHFDAHW